MAREEFERKQEEIKRRQAELKIDLNTVTFDHNGHVMTKKKFNTDRLPRIGKDSITRYSLDQAPLVENQFATLRQKFQKGLMKKVEQKSESGHKKNIYKTIEGEEEVRENKDKNALGSVETGGSFFNAFKPKDGVTLVESNFKVKKGDKLRATLNHLSRQDYSKTFSQKPFELKGILTHSHSTRAFGAKKAQGISFYEESTLPPIISPRDRYKSEIEQEDITQDFELDQSAIPVRKAEETIIKTGDISELMNFDKNFLDNTHEISTDSRLKNNAPTSVLPKYVNR